MNKWPRDRYKGPGGGLYTGPGGGLYTGRSDNPYLSNWPPIDVFIKELRKRKMDKYADIIEKHYKL